MPQLPPKPKLTFVGPGVTHMAETFGEKRVWGNYAANTLQMYPAGRPDKKQYFGDEVPKNYKTGENNAKIFVGDSYKQRARLTGRRWFRSWKDVKYLLTDRMQEVKKDAKEFSTILYTWNSESLNVIGCGSTKLKPIVPASIQTLSVARETAPQWSSNYEEVLTGWSKATKYIKQTVLFEGLSTVAPIISGLAIGYTAYLTRLAFLSKLRTKLMMKKEPNFGAYLQLQVNVEQLSRKKILDNLALGRIPLIRE
jgi:hypothetical protein